jgi:hypothetical protein
MIKQQDLSIFVSHSHMDNQFGIKLVSDLRKALGSNTHIWYDKAGGLEGGDEWWPKILKELVKSSIFIVILSPDSMLSKWVNDEVTIAWAHKNSSTGKIIIPILYRDCKIREDLQTLHNVSFLHPITYKAAFDELVKRLQIFCSKPPNTTNNLEREISTNPSSSFKLEKKYRRQNMLSTKNSYKPESIRSVHQKSALRAARAEALRAARAEVVQEIEGTEMSAHLKYPDKPIIL